MLGCPPDSDADTLYKHLKRIFIDHPWRDDDFPSLVLEQPDGLLSGCLGVVPRPMIFQKKTIQTAVSHSFTVEPQQRSDMSALSLIRRFIGGAQQLSMCQGELYSRRMWQLFGGSIAQLYSMNWIRSLRPTRHALSFASKHGLPKLLASALSPVGSAADLLAARIAPGMFKFECPGATGSELDVNRTIENLPHLLKLNTLQPSYTASSLQWLVDTMQLNPNRGLLRKVMVSHNKQVLGWYLYYLRDGVIAEVAQIVANEHGISKVFQHLLWQARQDGALAVSGQVEPQLFDTLGQFACLLRNANTRWLLMHSREPELLNAIHSGNAFATPRCCQSRCTPCDNTT